MYIKLNMLEEPSSHLLCSPHVLLFWLWRLLGQACLEGWEDFSLSTQVATILFRIHMMSRGVFGATVWSVQCVQCLLCLHSCLEYLGWACCSTCLCHLMHSRGSTAASPSWLPLGWSWICPVWQTCCLPDLIATAIGPFWMQGASAPSGFGSFGVKQCPLGEDMLRCQPGRLGLQFLFLLHDCIEL